ncbi:O-methyltransferase, family 2 [Niveomyces insectorum RCEF 264]|uniref:O-methyltransferase, family 2 n=1 Tax=Niveomyces insectorum RCEF 264 TaxID=1081102 RepID=A0A162MTY9_9HYPO|nr:O-methyltransferase, family 2 [Niveomyces insectorum RCEF 264]
MAQPQPTLQSLAQKITEATNALASYLAANDLPAPSFDENGPEDHPKAPEFQIVRGQLLDAMTDLHHLVSGPTDYASLTACFNNHENTVLDIFNQFNVFGAVPIGGSATYTEIAAATSLPETIVRRVMRYAFTVRLFAAAPAPHVDAVVHTATTALLAKNKNLRSLLAHNLEEMRPAAVFAPEALRKFSTGQPLQPSQEPTETAFSLADIARSGRQEGFFDYIRIGNNAQRFAEAMEAIAAASGFDRTETLKAAYDWAGLGTATVVDIGGASGHDATALAAAFPGLSLVVQDLPGMEPAFNETVPAALQRAGRVRFETHDFLQPQPRAADVYVLKWILHDWSDKYASQILRNLVPQLRAGDSRSRILVHEMVVPPLQGAQGGPTVPLAFQRAAAAVDLQMLVACNSLERTLEQWQALAKQADERLEARLAHAFPGTFWGLVEIVLRE